MNKRRDVIERFMSFVIIDSKTNCWFWTGSKDKKGYSRFWFNGQTRRAARVSYTLFIREIEDESLTIDHICRNIECVNPSDLELVTRVENLYRSNNYIAINRRKTHCYKGHEFNETNTQIVNGRKGRERRCKTCQKLNSKIANDRKKASAI